MRAVFALLVSSLALVTLASASPARADTFTVTSAADSGAGTLREALVNANATATGTPHAIVFDLPTAPAVIAVQTPLPSVTRSMTIDATTQPGYAGTPLVVLDGSADPTLRAFHVNLASATIAGFEIRNFGDRGVSFYYSSSSTVRACYLHHNGVGVSIAESVVTVGGASANDRNVFSNHVNAGIEATGGCNGTSIRGNYIGTNVAGDTAAPNAAGVDVTTNATGVAVGPGNVISGNAGAGVLARAGGIAWVFGNLIGTDATGTIAIPNATGVYAMGDSAYVGGNSVAARNVISGNTTGVLIYGVQGRVVGNYVGTDVTGSTAVANGVGVVLYGSSNIVGGSSPSDGNVISGNTNAGIQVMPNASSISVYNNRIGVAANGSALGNGSGVVVTQATGVQVGGLDAGNVIAHNGYGVRLDSGATAVVDSNSIFDHAMGAIVGNVLPSTPTLASAVPGAGTIAFTGALDAAPSGSYTVQYYDSASCEAGGRGETLIATAGVLTDASGHASLVHSFNANVPLGRYVTAIAIDDTAHNTSVFSTCRRVCDPVTLSPNALPAASLGASYSQTLTTSGGTGPYTYAITGGALPSGLALVDDTITGIASGGPFDGTVTVTATDATGCTAARTYAFSATCPTIAIGPSPIPNPTLGVPYSQMFEASGGTAPYTFSANGGLVTPLTWDAATATIAGTPSDMSQNDLFIHATDANGCEGVVRFQGVAQCPALAFTGTSVANGEPGASYTAALGVTGSSTAATFALASGTLPPGVTLASDGTLSGTLPNLDAVYTFAVVATGAYGCTATQTYTITVGSPASADAGVDGGALNPRSTGGCSLGRGANASALPTALVALAAFGLRVRRRRTR